MAIDDLIAAFLAKGGTIKRLPEGARATTESEIWQARRLVSGRSRSDAQDLSNPSRYECEQDF